MENLNFLTIDLALILLVASVATLVFKKLRQPIVLGYIAAGFLISPHFEWLPTVIDVENIEVWAEIGIVFLMFGIGLEFNLHKIAEVGRGAIITAGTVVAAMIAVGYSLGQLMGWSTMDSIFLGCMISMSSTMIVLKALEELNLKQEKFANLVVGSLVIEDLLGIFMMIILTTLSASKDIDGGAMALQLGGMLLILIALALGGIFVVPSIVKAIGKYLNDELLLIVSLGFCFISVVICVALGFSEALGAFVSGSILAGTKFAERIEHLVKPIKDLFGAVFFVSVGMMIVPSMIITYWKEIIAVTVTVVLGQMIFSGLGCLISGQSPRTSVRVGFTMLQVGEFSFILATLGISLGATSDFLYPIIVSVSVITSFTTPVFIKRGEKAYEMLEKILPDRFIDFLNKYTSAGKSAAKLDKDWKAYISYKIKRILIASAGMTAAVMFSTLVLENYIIGSDAMSPTMEKLLLAFISIVILIPFINIMCSRRNYLYTKLWHKSNFNRLPLLAIRAFCIFLSLSAVIVILRRYLLQLPVFVDFLIAFAMIAVIVRSDFVNSTRISLETRFLVNLNERIIERERLEREEKSDKVWIDEKMSVVEFEVLDNRKLARIKDFTSNKRFGCMAISIQRRGELFINLPKADTAIESGDVITMLGPNEGIEAYVQMLNNSDNVKEPENGAVTLQEYLYFQMFDEEISRENQFMCCALKPIRRNGKFYRKTIKECNFIVDYGGYILGIEREGLPIVGPSVNMQLDEEDIIWCIGTQDMVDKLEADDILML